MQKLKNLIVICFFMNLLQLIMFFAKGLCSYLTTVATGGLYETISNYAKSLTKQIHI